MTTEQQIIREQEKLIQALNEKIQILEEEAAFLRKSFHEFYEQAKVIINGK